VILIAYLAVSLAIAAALYGGWLTVQSFGGEARLIERRLGRPHAPHVESPALPGEPKPDESPFARFIDARIPALRRRLLAARAPFTPSQVVLGSLGGFAGLLIALSVVGVPPLFALAAAGWGGLASPLLLISFLAARRQRLFTQQMPQAVDLMARSLQAGHPVTTAMAVASRQMPDPMGPELSVVISEMSYGLDRDTALRNLLQRFPIPELRMFAASLEVTRETGGNVAEVLLNLGEAMRAKAQLRKKVAAISAEGRMSFWVVSALPVVVVGVLLLIAPEYYTEVSGDPLFWPLMSGPPLMWTIGALMIWRMINFKI
jgi:tight adherence protein B